MSTRTIRRQNSRHSQSSSSNHSGSSSNNSFHDKLRCFTLCLFCLAVFNFTMLHLVQSALIGFYGEDSFLSFSQDLIANWDPTTYSDDKSILPDKIITVIGKESSGTTFVAKTIAHALKIPGRQKYRDGYFHHERRAYDDQPIQVQHVSLPQGQWCLQNHSHHIVDVILPPHCVTSKNGGYPSDSFPGIKQQCEALLNSTTMTGKNNNNNNNNGNTNGAMQLYEGMMEMHGPWFMKTRWKNQFYYKAVRYPGRTFAQSEKVRSHNVTIIRRKPGRGEKMSREEIMERREERRRQYHEQLLGTAFDNADSAPAERDYDEDPPPIVIQRGTDIGSRVSGAERLHGKASRDPHDKRRLGEVPEEEEEEEQTKSERPEKTKFYFEGGQVKQEGADGASRNEQQRNHPPRHRGFQHDMSNLTEEQKKELQRRLRITNGGGGGGDHDVPSGDWGEPSNGKQNDGHEETQNEKIRRQNRERKREMMRREREERIRHMDKGNAANDDELMLHGRRPTRLSKQQKIDDWLRRVKKYPLEQLQNNNLLMYPGRFMLNITSQKIWYDAHGTEQVIVIVVRDPEMSFKSRLKSHCHIVELAQEEEAIANAILNDAIQTFFLNDKSGFQNGFGGRWYGKTVEEIKQEAFLWDPTPIIENRTSDSGGNDPFHSSRIPSSNNVVLVSYEAMMKYEQEYVSELYKVMGIESQYKPVFKDGNAKYRTDENDQSGGSIGRRRRKMQQSNSTEDDVGFRFRWLLRQPERYQGILLAVACCSVFVGSFTLWVLIFWLFFRRAANKKRNREAKQENHRR